MFVFQSAFAVTVGCWFERITMTLALLQEIQLPGLYKMFSSLVSDSPALVEDVQMACMVDPSQFTYGQ